MNPKVDFYFNKAGQWQEALEHLRTMMLESSLTEELKWGVPCYTWQQKNIILLHCFKNYCAVLFIKGALLQDAHRVLIQQTERVQAARQIRFRSVQEIVLLEPVVRAYVQEALDAEKAGLNVALKQTAAFHIPAEFQHQLEVDGRLATAFYALTPGRQRAYLLHFGQPKQAATRQARVDRCKQHIMNGKGLNE